MSEPSPYRTLAVASGFTPRFFAVLAEARAMAAAFDAELCVLHAGTEGCAPPEAQFREAFAQLGLEPALPIFSAPGAPGEVIPRLAAEQGVDLLIAGALEREIIHRPFTGGVAREFLRRAPCDLLLFTQPEREPRPARALSLVSDFSAAAEAALRKALWLGERVDAESLHVVSIHTAFDKARAELAGASEGEAAARLREFVVGVAGAEVAEQIEQRVLTGATGAAADEHAQAIGADLLIVPASRDADEPLPKNLRWLLETIPCNLWVVRAGAAE